MEYELYIEPYTCSFHKEKPDEDFAGCSCCDGFWMVRKGTGYKPKIPDVLDILNE